MAGLQTWAGEAFASISSWTAAEKRSEPRPENHMVITDLTTERAMKEIFNLRKKFQQDETRCPVAVGVSLDKDSVRVNHLVCRDETIPSPLAPQTFLIQLSP
eukprot:755029-Hanusia_phi.AAC.27